MIFEKLYAANADILNQAVEGIGVDNPPGFPVGFLAEARQQIYKAFDSCAPSIINGFDPDLWNLLLTAAEDPETAVPDWLRTGCPSGMGDSSIAACGVLPRADHTSAAILKAQAFGLQQQAMAWQADKHRNYVSFYTEGGKLAEEEITRIAGKGFIELFDTWEQVTARWPKATASKIALLIKERPDGTMKKRIIIDLLRSGINGEVVNPERVVLPRISDFKESIIDLLETRPHEEVELCTLDFEDAFHTLLLREPDRGVLVFKTTSGWAAFRRLCCGMAAAPLVWCRVAAAGCRLGQALYHPNELRIQCFVDDPAIAVRGDQATRRKLLSFVLLLWALLGFQFQWKKGSRGRSITWIGVQFTVDVIISIHSNRLFPGVLVELTPKKLQELVDLLTEILNMTGMVPIAQVQKVAGMLSWISGIFKYVKPFNACLWGAITAHALKVADKAPRTSIKKRPSHLIFVLQIKQAIRWVHKLVTGNLRPQAGRPLQLQRWTSIETRLPEALVAVRTDASPWGMGAVLFIHGQPCEWMAIDWDKADLHLLQAILGDPAWQAEWELFAILLAIDSWLPHLQGKRAALIQTDATAALFNVERMAGRTPAMNSITAEIALRLEAADVMTTPEHVPGVLNFTCDALSRLSQGAQIPPQLVHLPRVWPRPRLPSFFWA